MHLSCEVGQEGKAQAQKGDAAACKGPGLELAAAAQGLWAQSWPGTAHLPQPGLDVLWWFAGGVRAVRTALVFWCWLGWLLIQCAPSSRSAGLALLLGCGLVGVHMELSWAAGWLPPLDPAEGLLPFPQVPEQSWDQSVWEQQLCWICHPAACPQEVAETMGL